MSQSNDANFATGSVCEQDLFAVEGRTVRLGQVDSRTGRLVLSPDRTKPTAEAFLRRYFMLDGLRTLHNYAGQMYAWRHNRYVVLDEAELRAMLHEMLHESLTLAFSSRGTTTLQDFRCNANTVAHALEAVRNCTYLGQTTAVPAWLDGENGRPPAREILPCRTKNLHLPTGEIIPTTPQLFNTTALDYDYEVDPEPPERFLKFLEQVFGDDLDSVRCLQEWLGYLVSGSTRHQKMMLLIGPRRSGKGTLGRVISALLGADNVVGPTIGSLSGPFGLQSLLNKSAAIVSDARFSGEGTGVVVERLLTISGEDLVTVDRKFLPSLTTKLGVRFMFMANELPRFNDSSNALVGRFLLLRITRSFYGMEDVNLTEKLLTELPGILKWAIDGLRRLNDRGYFVQPSSGEALLGDLEELASPIAGFLRDRCEVGSGFRVPVSELYEAWVAWSQRSGRDHTSTVQVFGRDLTSACPGVARRRGTHHEPFYDGIRLRPGRSGP
jgi:putative DNA primase/helicase